MSQWNRSYKRTPWYSIDWLADHLWESDVEEWQVIDTGRCGIDGSLAVGYDLRNRAEIEEWAQEYGFTVNWR